VYFPKLTAYQTIENSQGTLDPLGLYSISDRLATRLAPGFRERMKHPRYLTAIAVGSIVCSAFNEDDIAKDGVSPPWQVYEWYIASALVKSFEKTNQEQLRGMPAREKTTNALRAGLHLNHSRYLKTANVFGFHGVYRTLAKELRLINGVHIGEFGIQLLDIWESEQDLEGFRTNLRDSKGARFRKWLVDAVSLGLKQGEVSKPWNWQFYNEIAQVLAPKSPGPKESEILFTRLLEGLDNLRSELIHFIQTPAAQQRIETYSEKRFHEEFLKTAIHSKPLITAILSYEKFARLIHNAFYGIIQWLNDHQLKGSIEDFSKLDLVKKAFAETKSVYQQTEDYFSEFREELVLLNNSFFSIKEPIHIKDWVKALIAHHMKIQSHKPPNGKASWLLESSKDNYLLNTMRSIEGAINTEGEYVHQYRTYALQSFLYDLKKLNN
jgi:hypothetical protein